MSLSRTDHERIVEIDYEKSKESEEGLYNDFLKDLKRNRERWLLRQANVDKIRESFDNNIKNNFISFVDDNNKKSSDKNNIMDINDIIDQEFSSYNQEVKDDNLIDEFDFMPIKKIKN